MKSLLLLIATLFLVTIATPALAAGNLLEGKSPARVSDVSNAGVLTDGKLALEGEDWNSTAAAVFKSERAFVEFDLGKSTKIGAALLQGDNNDEYLVAVSDDRTTFTPLWTAGVRNEPGLRERFTDSINGQGRYVRLTVRGGDRAYSATELQLFTERPASTSSLPRVSGENQAARVRSGLVYLVAAFGLFLFFAQAGSTPGRILLGALAPLAAAYFAYDSIESAWPLVNREVAFVRAAAAAIAFLAVIRRLVPGKRWPAHRKVINVTLGVSAVMAFAAFYNLGRPQFHNHAEGRPEFVHTYDMRVYQPFARHFKELQYDGVYNASVLAFAEDQRGGSLESLARQEVRSLRDHRVRHVDELGDELKELRRRFTDANWAELKKDMKYFEDVMGPEFLGTLTDHGANATPVWVFFARLLIGHAPASEGLLTMAGLADGALLLLTAVALWRTFGLMPMLLAMTVFGANDLYMFGTNWTGATLRHDWLALLGLGAAALKKERWALAGVLLALSAMIRAFPVAALVGVAIPPLWWFAERWRIDRKMPHYKTILAEQGPAVRVLVAAAACIVGMVLLTSLLYGFSSWINWWAKVTLLNRDVGVNEISLRALVAGADNTAGRVLQTRRVIFGAAQVAVVVCIAFLARRRPLYQAMLLAMPLVLVIWNPSNYYSHFVYLIALLASTSIPKKSTTPEAEPEPGAIIPLAVPFHQVAIPLLLMCVGGYWCSLDPDLERHFQGETVLLFLALGALYVSFLRRDPATKQYFAG
jgi:hypothetical protein